METPPRIEPYGNKKFQLNLNEDELYIIMTALDIKFRLNMGSIDDALRQLPIDYDKYYNTESWTDWNLTIDIIRQLISQFTIDNVDGWHDVLSVEGSEVRPECLQAYEMARAIRDVLVSGPTTSSRVVELTTLPQPCAIVDESTSNCPCNDDLHRPHQDHDQ